MQQSPGDELEAAVAEARKANYPRSNDHALHDFSLPAMVRGFIAMNMGPATEVMAIKEAGFMPRLYGTYKEKRVRVVLISSMGDIGVAFKDVDQYSERCSIYDLTDFGDEMFPTAPSKRPMLTYYTLVDNKGRWLKENNMDEGHYTQASISSAPTLFAERSTANAIRRRIDERGVMGYDVIPVKLSKAPE